ncbi:MAG TPA: hypothetical protein VFD03_04200 [Clostridia bacterium]|nr:hypothetical protein [Clostridia bacterium]
MNINKRVLGNVDMVYATAIMNIKGQLNYIVASEGQNSCIAYNSDSFEKQTVWDSPGGTMNIVPIPGREDEFIATQKFFPIFDAKESKIVYAKLDNCNRWDIQPIMNIPYLHRFDIFELKGELHFIGCTLCSSKETKDDWSNPGKVYVGKLSNNIVEPFELTIIIGEITKNHGFCSTEWKGRKSYIVTGVEGAYVIYVPDNEKDWEYEKILDHEVSDIAVVDIDGDGNMEIATIEPFHGNKAVIYKNISEKWMSIYECELEFGHVVWGGNILNKPSFIIGERKGSTKLICVQMKESLEEDYAEYLIDNTGGTSNISVVHQLGKDIILAANREIGEVAIYELTK